MDLSLDPICLLLYAEMHYAPRFLFSLLRKNQPEILADAPHRVEPLTDVPVLCLIKDADQYPIALEEVNLRIAYPSGRTHQIPFETKRQVIRDRVWTRVFPFSPLEAGPISVHVTFRFRRDRRTHIVRNDNYRGTSHAPLSVRVAKNPLPRVPGWHYGEAHLHTIYTSDQVEFGAPPLETARLARAMGLEWMTITDHSYDLDDHHGRNTPHPSPWEALHADVERIHRDLTGFVALAGEEISCGTSTGKNVHLLAYGLRTFIEGAGDSGRKGLDSAPDLTIPDVLARIRRQGGVGYAAHPIKVPSLAQRLLIRRGIWTGKDLREEGLSGLQVWNGERTNGFEEGKREWIDLLLEGRRLALGGGSDAHGNFNRFRQISVPLIKMIERVDQTFGTPRTALWLPSGLREESVLRALRTGASVVTDGPFLACTAHGDDGVRAGIGETLRAEHLRVDVAASTTEEFGSFDRIVLHFGDLRRREERTLWRGHAAPREGIPARCDGPGYLRMEGTTLKGQHCLTNPIWIEPPTP